jgi:hypothetical protein
MSTKYSLLIERVLRSAHSAVFKQSISVLLMLINQREEGVR